MAKQHPRHALVAALLAQDPEVFAQAMGQLFEHLLDLCPDCRQEYESFTEEENRAPGPSSYGDAVARGIEGIRGQGESLDRLRRAAARDFSALMKLRGSARRMRIHRALTRFRSPYLVDRFLAESARQVTADPFEALELAECAHEVALRLSAAELGSSWCMAAIARSHAYRGNALRATGDFKSAEPLLEVASTLFAEHGTGDPLVLAELAALLGSLRKDQRRFVEAETLLDQAIELYRACGETVGAARELIAKATLLNSGLGDTERAVATVQDALAVLDPETERRLYLSAHHNLVHYLHDLGRNEEARERLAAAVDLYRGFPDAWTQLRLAWLEGKIALGLGRLEEAEVSLEGVRQGFIGRGLGFDAALAGLDLALVYLEMGEGRQLRRLAQEMVPIFMAQDIHREAIAALMLFLEAARKETVTRSMIEELSRYMERVRRLPADRPS